MVGIFYSQSFRYYMNIARHCAYIDVEDASADSNLGKCRCGWPSKSNFRWKRQYLVHLYQRSTNKSNAISLLPQGLYYKIGELLSHCLIGPWLTALRCPCRQFRIVGSSTMGFFTLRHLVSGMQWIHQTSKYAHITEMVHGLLQRT
jgi:hypothetical protein